MGGSVLPYAVKAWDNPLEVLYGLMVAEDFANTKQRWFGLSIRISVDDSVGEEIAVISPAQHDRGSNIYEPPKKNNSSQNSAATMVGIDPANINSSLAMTR